MNENLKKVFEELQGNEEFRKQIKEIPPKTEEDLAALLKKFGVDVSPEDLKCAKKELSEEELEKVSGGITGTAEDMLNECDFWYGLWCGIAAGGALYMGG